MNAVDRIAYFNDAYLPLGQVQVSPLDRGFLFADGVYDLVPVYRGHCLRLDDHLARLENGLAALRLQLDWKRADWTRLVQTLVERNGGGDVSVYLQVTRGAAATREHGFPQATRPTVFAMVNPLQRDPRPYEQGWKAVIVDDIRWGACHIKTIALLANVLARQQALDQDADDAILVRGGWVTECAAGNAYLVQNGVIRTPVKDRRILPGITRIIVLELAQAAGIPVREEDIAVADLQAADEVWASSSTKEIVPIVQIDGRAVGTGRPGPLWQRMMELYQVYKDKICPAAVE